MSAAIPDDAAELAALRVLARRVGVSPELLAVYRQLAEEVA